jgi:regulator of cell morphogenesis and NO signaling
MASLATVSPAPVTTAGPGPAARLIDTILATHHVLARELSGRIPALAAVVNAEAGQRDPRLAQVADTCDLLKREMLSHLEREEQVLFPLIRELEAEGGGDEGDFGLLFSPIVCMKREHRFIDDIFTELRTLTDGFTPPAGASDRHRALLADLDRFERDTFEHVHKENDELFPLANDLVPAVR